MKNIIKNEKTMFSAKLDIWESKYIVSGYYMKKTAKRVSNKAQRRLNKSIIKESL